MKRTAQIVGVLLMVGALVMGLIMLWRWALVGLSEPVSVATAYTSLVGFIGGAYLIALSGQL